MSFLSRTDCTIYSSISYACISSRQHSRRRRRHHHHHHHHHYQQQQQQQQQQANMELGHFLTCPGLTRLEVSVIFYSAWYSVVFLLPR
jgi:hypothetical protein